MGYGRRRYVSAQERARCRAVPVAAAVGERCERQRLPLPPFCQSYRCFTLELSHACHLAPRDSAPLCPAMHPRSARLGPRRRRAHGLSACAAPYPLLPSTVLGRPHPETATRPSNRPPPPWPACPGEQQHTFARASSRLPNHLTCTRVARDAPCPASPPPRLPCQSELTRTPSARQHLARNSAK
jgi:hypothetical protein